ncbi:MAG: hypothetical protein ACD_66C00055G0001 [uncultured bacterium]|nr:MAG: hypothetical protein ACD_66C00055G0001 [uncultured bacterium]
MKYLDIVIELLKFDLEQTVKQKQRLHSHQEN